MGRRLHGEIMKPYRNDIWIQGIIIVIVVLVAMLV